MRFKLRLHDPGQRFPCPQARYQNLQKGREASDASGENESTDQKNYFPRTQGVVWREKRLCCVEIFIG